MSEYDVINRRAARLDAPDKATGRAKYVDDLSLPGMLYGALLQSPLAHARILHIDTSRARRLPGVEVGGHGRGCRPGALRGQPGALR